MRSKKGARIGKVFSLGIPVLSHLPVSLNDSMVCFREMPVNKSSSQGLWEGSTSILVSIYFKTMLSPKIALATLIQLSELIRKLATLRSFHFNLPNVSSLNQDTGIRRCI